MGALSELIVEEIRARGPIGFTRYMDLALYHPELGFYAAGERRGRRGDFLTSPEVGPLFGTVLARAIDRWWDELGRPDPWVVVDAGAGPGTLAIAVLAAEPECAPALRYVLVEASASQRARHGDHLDLTPASHAFMGDEDSEENDIVGPPGPYVISLPDLPRDAPAGVIIANELLDNLAFAVLERRADGWDEVRVGLSGDGPVLREVLVPASENHTGLADRLTSDVAPGARIPVQGAAADWLHEAWSSIDRGRVVVIDYSASTSDLAARPDAGWLRTFRAHERGGSPLESPGDVDITADVALDQLTRVHRPVSVRSQAEFLRAHGIEDLVEEGRRGWADGAATGDLEALRARSRIREAEALLDPEGLGGFTVTEWER